MTIYSQRYHLAGLNQHEMVSMCWVFWEHRTLDCQSIFLSPFTFAPSKFSKRGQSHEIFHHLLSLRYCKFNLILCCWPQKLSPYYVILLYWSMRQDYTVNEVYVNLLCSEYFCTATRGTWSADTELIKAHDLQTLNLSNVELIRYRTYQTLNLPITELIMYWI